MCELLIFRDPNSDQLCMLGRTEDHVHQGTVSFSDDEGLTWTKPRMTPFALTGDRLKMSQDPISGRLVISFRDFLFIFNDDGVLLSSAANDFVAWVGTYDQLVLG